MPRYSKEIKELGERNRLTMLKHDTFHEWQKAHLMMKGRIDDYEKAYNYINRGAGDEQEVIELRPSDED